MNIVERAKEYCSSEDGGNEIIRLLCDEIVRPQAALESVAVSAESDAGHTMGWALAEMARELLGNAPATAPK